MRNVLKSQSEVAHFWANKVQPSGRAKSMFFEDGKIYSYGRHFCIARWVGDIVLFTYRSYSNTTAKHINYVNRAIPYGTTKISCYDPEAYPAINIRDYKSKINDKIKEFEKKRKKERYFISHIENGLEQMRQYCELFDIDETGYFAKVKAWVNGPASDMAAKYEARQVELDAIRNTPAYLEKKRKEHNRRHRAQLNEYGKLLRKWRNGEGYRLSSDLIQYDFLRLQDGRVMTTQAVEIPIICAVKFYERIKSGLLSVGDSVLHFTVRAIQGNTVRIGCHTFKLSYLRNFGRHLVENNIVNSQTVTPCQ